MQVRTKKINIMKTLGLLKKMINVGYTPENFENIDSLMKQLQPHVDPNKFRRLSEMWRNSYTDSCELSELNSVIDSFKLSPPRA